MSKYSLAPAIPRIPVIAGMVVVLVYFLTRLALAFYLGFDGAQFKGFDAVPLPFWPEIFLKGLWFDLCVASALIAPICLYEALLPNTWRATTWHKTLRLAWLWLAITLMLLFAVAEVAFWLEYSTRFNAIALDELAYTKELIGNLRESYPVVKILAGLGVTAAVILFAISPYVRRAEKDALTWLHRAGLALFVLIVPAGMMHFANVDQMQEQYLPLVGSETTAAIPPGLRKIAGIPSTGVVNPRNNVANALSGNGLFTIAAELRFKEPDYDLLYRTIPQPQANTALVALGAKRTSLGDARKADLSDEPATNVTPFSSKPKNIIMITVDNLSANHVGAYGSAKGLTPEIDKLSNAGIKFESVFATGNRTVHGLEALSLGIPSLPGKAILNRPGNDHLATVGELLNHQGMDALFFYGGNGSIDNMKAYYTANNYRVIDRNDMPDGKIGFENTRGVADEYLYEQVLRTLDENGKKGIEKGTNGKPFFAQILTSSNHRPYTYPAQRIDIASPGGREGAVKYSDHAIGKFIKDASKKAWFKDTLFVIVADHSASVGGNLRRPVAGYRIPLIFYAPALLKPALFTPMVSQIDIAPTLMEVLGKNGSAQFFGRSFFEAGAPPERAFISNYQALGYLKNNTLTVLLPKQVVESYKVDPKTWATTPAPVDNQLLTEAIAYYQTAAKAFKTGELKAPFYVKPLTPTPNQKPYQNP